MTPFDWPAAGAAREAVIRQAARSFAAALKPSLVEEVDPINRILLMAVTNYSFVPLPGDGQAGTCASCRAIWGNPFLVLAGSSGAGGIAARSRILSSPIDPIP